MTPFYKLMVSFDIWWQLVCAYESIKSGGILKFYNESTGVWGGVQYVYVRCNATK